MDEMQVQNEGVPVESTQQAEVFEGTPPAGEATEAPAVSAAQEPASQDWRASLPEAWREKVKDMASLEDVEKALERGMGYAPASSVEEIKLKFPEGFSVDDGVSKRFKEVCVELGITPAQAQSLVEYQIGANREIVDSVIADGSKKLKESWGSRYDENTAQALKAVTALDRRMGGRLSEALAFSGMNNNPALVEAFYEIGKLTSEDSLAGGSPAVSPDQPESPADSYSGLFKE